MVYWRMRARTTVVAGAMGKVWRYAGGRLGGSWGLGLVERVLRGLGLTKKILWVGPRIHERVRGGGQGPGEGVRGGLGLMEGS